jgi:hypothetical protein
VKVSQAEFVLAGGIQIALRRPEGIGGNDCHKLGYGHENVVDRAPGGDEAQGEIPLVFHVVKTFYILDLDADTNEKGCDVASAHVEGYGHKDEGYEGVHNTADYTLL